MSATRIEWTEQTWNPIVGCSIVSPGCTNCYAMRMAARLQKMNRTGGSGSNYVNHYDGTTQPSKAGPVWTGKIARAPDKLFLKPLHVRKPTVFFVNSMGDLFHESIPDEWIDKVFAVMALCPQHTFQCLTKRADRMWRYCSAPDITHRVARAVDAMLVDLDHDPQERWAPVPEFPDYEASTHGRVRRGSVILQEQVNQRFDRPSVTLWQNNEPATRWVHTLVLSAHRGAPCDGEEACHRNGNQLDNRLANLRWGTRGENQHEKVRHGSNGGPAKLTREQAAEIRTACAAGETQQVIAKDRKVWPDAIGWPLSNVWAGISAERQEEADERIPHLLQTPAAIRFVSCEPLIGPIDLGLGNWVGLYTGRFDDPPTPQLNWVITGGESGPKARPSNPMWFRAIRDQCEAAGVKYFHKQNGEWVSVSEVEGAGPHHTFPDGRTVRRLGKKAAGRLLDGREHNGMPEVRT